MKRNQLKFWGGATVIVAALTWLGITGISGNISYNQTVPELMQTGEAAHTRRTKVSGEVVPGSIYREGHNVKFVIAEKLNVKGEAEGRTLPVNYVGREVLTDTFRERANAVVTGKLGRDGTFVADEVLAKCASKYSKEAAAGVLVPGSEQEHESKPGLTDDKLTED